MGLFVAFATILSCFGAKAQSLPAHLPSEEQQQMLRQQPLLFMENKGQVKDHQGKNAVDVLFTASNAGAKLFITATGIHYQFTKSENSMPKIVKADNLKRTNGKTETHRFTVALQGSNTNPQVVAEKQAAYTETYLNAGNNIQNVKSFERITLKNVYKGIDWVIYNKDGFMEYDFIVHPGSDASQIKLKVTDADEMQIAENGSLKIKTRLGEVTEKAPVSFDEAGNKLATSFRKNSDGTLGFEVANAPKGKMLRIDPIVVWATYYGGPSHDSAEACATDSNGNVYLKGTTSSTVGIASGGGYQTTPNSSNTDFVVKFSSTGSRLWGTYTDQSHGLFSQIAVDAAGNVFVTGETSNEFNFGATVHQENFGGGPLDAYIIKINANGTLGWKTFYGGNGTDYGKSCSVDANGNVYLAGYSNSTNGIATSGSFKSSYSQNENSEYRPYDAYLVKFTNNGTRLWGTYIGGSNNEEAYSCTVDAMGNVYIAGQTNSSDGIGYKGFKNAISGNGLDDGFLIKFNASGQRQWGTYYGGNYYEHVFACTTDLAGNVYIAGRTESFEGIASNGYQNTGGQGIHGGADGFLAKFTGSGNREWGTYYGTGQYDDWGMACKTDLKGNVYLAGFSQTPSGEVSLPSKAFIIKYSNSGQYIWDQAYQGNIGSSGYGLATDASGNAYLCGMTSSTSGISFAAYQSMLAGEFDGFLIKINGFGSYNCSEPRLLKADVTSATSANISWAAPGTGFVQGYEYTVTQNPEPPESGTATTSVFINLQGLSAGQYYLHVRAVCAPGRFSEWATLAFCAVAAPVSSPYTLCGGQTFGDLDIEGQEIKYYDEATGGAAIALSQEVVMGTYYISQTVNGCESARTMIYVIVNPSITYYADTDGDGWGDAANTVAACAKPEGYIEKPGDCDDNNPAITLCAGAIYSTLLPEYCGVTMTSLNEMIHAQTVSGANRYRFRISINAGDSVVVENSVAWFRLRDVPGVAYSSNYNVEVAVRTGETWQPYGQGCLVAIRTFTTQVSAEYCGTTVSSFNELIYADAVSMATSYRFRINDGITTQVITKPSRYFYINEINGYNYNKTYTIDVAAGYNGTYLGYGLSCNINTMSAPVSKVEEGYCGTAVSSLKSVIYAEGIPLATQYLFRITSTAGTFVIGKQARYIHINEIPGYTYGRNYSISVAVQLNGEYGSFGPSCVISTPAVPTTSVVATQCGGTVASLSERVYIAQVQQAQGYRIRLTIGAGVQTIDRAFPDFRLDMFTLPSFNVEYSIEIAVLMNGSYGPYGPACTITAINAMARQGKQSGDNIILGDDATVSQQVITLTAYPNPYTDTFTFDMATPSGEKVTVRAYDMNGRLMHDISVSPEELQSQKLGSGYAAGVYNLIVMQGDYQKIFKIVKK